jgi:proteasome lid subunit RPN8/RPN11
MKRNTEQAKGSELRMSCEAARQIRQHARASSKAEVCGVLIGAEDHGVTTVEASIPGAKAVQGGSHVTFTQDTWEHIYHIKDRDYPEARIVGWYHSHPGFGVFLSDHDSFIHKNFFSAPRQVAWVYDPHSDEEGCWNDCRKLFLWMQKAVRARAKLANLSRCWITKTMIPMPKLT